MSSVTDHEANVHGFKDLQKVISQELQKCSMLFYSYA